jgi:K+-transporting ATPase ATPase B chain
MATETLPPRTPLEPSSRRSSLFQPKIVRRAVAESFLKLNPRTEARNPIMFVVLIGAVWTTVLFIRDLGRVPTAASVFGGLVALWLWFTVLFANFAEALAEGRGKAQAESLRRARRETMANVLHADGSIEEIPSTKLTVGDLVEVTVGMVIPGDGDVVEGIAHLPSMPWSRRHASGVGRLHHRIRCLAPRSHAARSRCLPGSSSPGDRR